MALSLLLDIGALGRQVQPKESRGNKETPAVLRVGRSQVDRDPLEVGARPCVRLSQSLTEHLLNCAFSGVFT